MPQPDLDLTAGQGGEELRLGPGRGRGRLDVAAQRDPGRLGLPGPGRVPRLGPARPPGRGPVGPGHRHQAVLGLDVAQRLADPVVLVVQMGPAAIVAGQHGHDMDVVAAVVHRDPRHRLVFLAVAGQAGAVHDLRRDPHPRAVAQVRVAGRGADRAVPHRVGRGAVAEHRQRNSISPVRRRKSRWPPGRSGGSSSAGCRHPATRCGFTCSQAFPGP